MSKPTTCQRLKWIEDEDACEYDNSQAAGNWVEIHGVDLDTVHNHNVDKDKLGENMVKTRSLANAHRVTAAVQKLRGRQPPVDQRINGLLLKNTALAATSCLACWMMKRQVGVEVDVQRCTSFPAKEVGKRFFVVWRIDKNRVRGSTPEEARPILAFSRTDSSSSVGTESKDPKSMLGSPLRASASNLANYDNDSGYLEEATEIAKMERIDEEIFQDAIAASKGESTARGEKALARLGVIWNFKFVFIHSLIATRQGRVMNRQPLVFDIVESRHVQSSTRLRPDTEDSSTQPLCDPAEIDKQLGRVIGSVAVHLSNHINLCDPFAEPKAVAYAVIPRIPMAEGNSTPMQLHVKLNVIVPTPREEDIAKTEEKKENLLLPFYDAEAQISEEELLEMAFQRSVSYQIPSVDQAILGLRKERCLTEREFEHQMHKVLINPHKVKDKKRTLQISCSLKNADETVISTKLLPAIEARVGYSMADRTAYQANKEMVAIMHFKSAFDAKVAKNILEEMSVTIFPINVHYSDMSYEAFTEDKSHLAKR